MSVYNIIFSPTGGTQKVADIFTKSFSAAHTDIDLTCRSLDFSAWAFSAEDICIVSVPSYGGRVPNAAISRLRQMQGGGAKAILIVVYGNRAYDDTLIELQDVLTERGFACIAAVAAIAEHSIMRQFAAERPDKNDEMEIAAFAKTIQSRLKSADLSAPLHLPGNRPYRKYDGVPMKPEADKTCSQCGVCAEACPVGAIPADAPSQTDKQKCISCMRCLAICPQNARHVSKVLLAAGSLALKNACAKPKKNELFMP